MTDVNFVRELAASMPIPNPEESPLGIADPHSFREAFAEWLAAVSQWQDEVEHRLARLEGRVEALCQIASR